MSGENLKDESEFTVFRAEQLCGKSIDTWISTLKQFTCNRLPDSSRCIRHKKAASCPAEGTGCDCLSKQSQTYRDLQDGMRQQQIALQKQ